MLQSNKCISQEKIILVGPKPLTLFRIGRGVGKKAPTPFFSAVTSINVGVSP